LPKVLGCYAAFAPEQDLKSRPVERKFTAPPTKRVAKFVKFQLGGHFSKCPSGSVGPTCAFVVTIIG